MKTLSILFSLSLFLHAELKFPSKVYTMDNFPEAAKQAVDEGKGISFMISDLNSTCPKCNKASRETVSALSDKSVIIQARVRSELPYKAFLLIKDVERGQYIPFTYVFSNDLSKFLGIVRYKEVKASPQTAFKKVIGELEKL